MVKLRDQADTEEARLHEINEQIETTDTELTACKDEKLIMEE